MAQKNDAEKRQTKAGMLKKNSPKTGGAEKAETNSEKDSENTPKISKEKAEGEHNDKPIH
jgi:hypothetical protein